MPKFKDTITDMNRYWSVVQRAYMIKDTRAEYLQTFELSLGQNYPGLWTNKRYLRFTGYYDLPQEGYLTLKTYRAWMILYTMIMEDAGLLSRQIPDGTENGDTRSDAFGD